MSMVDDDQTGAIDTEDNSGAAPVMGGETPQGSSVPAQDDSTGVDQQAAQQAPQGQAPSPGGLGQPQGPLAPVAKKIISYLMGADAAHPQTIDQVGSQVDPEGKLPPADRNLIALDHVRDTQGDQAAWQLMQANRVAYNAQTAFAKTALQGTAQKPASIDSAIDAANKAQANVLDGSNVTFAKGQAGVTATVTMPGTKQPQTINLSPKAFNQWLDVGADGQWDKVMDQGAPATLQRLSKQYPTQAAPAAPQQPQAGGAPPAQNNSRAPTGQVPGTGAMNPNDAPGTVTRKEYQDPTFSGKLTDDQKQLQRSYAMFPGSNLDAQQNARREQWLSAQEQESNKLENNIDVAAEKGKRALDVARETGQGRRDVATTAAGAKVQSSQNYSNARVQAALAKVTQEQAREEKINGRSDKAVAMAALRTKIGTGAKLAPNEQAYWDRTIGGTAEPGQQQAPQAQPRQQQAPTQSGAQTPPVAGAKLYQGKWYTRGPNGESVPVQ